MISWITDICPTNPLSLIPLISSTECCQISGLDKLTITITIYAMANSFIFWSEGLAVAVTELSVHYSHFSPPTLTFLLLIVGLRNFAWGFK